MDFIYQQNGGVKDISIRQMRDLIREHFGIDLYFPNDGARKEFVCKANVYFRISAEKFPNGVGNENIIKQTKLVQGFEWNYGDSINIHGSKFTCGSRPDQENKLILGYRLIKAILVDMDYD